MTLRCTGFKLPSNYDVGVGQDDGRREHHGACSVLPHLRVDDAGFDGEGKGLMRMHEII